MSHLAYGSIEVSIIIVVCSDLYMNYFRRWDDLFILSHPNHKKKHSNSHHDDLVEVERSAVEVDHPVLR